ILQIRRASAENVSFGFPNVGNTYRISGARKSAFTIAAVLPEGPVTPRRCGARLIMIIRNPQPTIRQDFLLHRTDFWAVQSLPKIIFAPIYAGIYPSAFANSFNERNCLISAHRSARVVTVFFKIEYWQNTSAGAHDRIGLLPCIRHDAEKMIGLADRIRGVAIMIRAPE